LEVVRNLFILRKKVYTCLHGNIYIVLEIVFVMVYDEILKGEERKIVSTRLYRPEFANFIKICESEGKSINAKLREMVRNEIGRKMGGVL